MQPRRTYVQLTGAKADIERLAPLLHDAGAEVVREVREGIETWYIQHPDFAASDDVNRTAANLVDAVKGLHLAGHGEAPAVGTQGQMVVAPDGGRVFYTPLTETVNHRDSVRISQEGPSGSRVWPDDAVREAVAIGFRNENLAKAARILVRQGETWVGLYKVHECIRDGGIDVIAKGLCSQTQLKRFTHTANSYAALGEQARHASQSSTMPTNPMGLGEARQFIQGLLLAATQIKTS